MSKRRERNGGVAGHGSWVMEMTLNTCIALSIIASVSFVSDRKLLIFGKGFRKRISYHVSCWYVGNFDCALPHHFCDKSLSTMNIFCSGMVFGIVCKGFGTLVVTEKVRRLQLVLWDAYRLQELLKPDCFFCRLCAS